ncbi:MAG: GAF domain-containing protein [Alphaproteobacteria bacterium]|nr:GAF domain-containing protein [Alphaproteobacteria bacterium]
MHAALIAEDEADRLATLEALSILDTAPEPLFDALVGMTAAAAQAPIAMVSLVDFDRQWFKARCGVETHETERRVAFCAHAILSDQPLVVPDARLDPRFCDNPLVLGPPHLRAYLGAPLIAANGRRIGTLCAVDTAPHAWSADDVDRMQRLAALTTRLMELRIEAPDAHERLSFEACGACMRIRVGGEGWHDVDGAIESLGETADMTIALCDECEAGMAA